ncbi:MAG: type IV-A pilus assembly ATPase PilB [Endomicrobia bacterium]|nr:type IV-A pilus assembly ATPase PilB [Endomicrobiia bacterium]MCX7940624.1 type IV-A pilus assembly ATPase PilB [Endomicrobiia bacterium]MDW8055306.1 type IV-A pilus assembly ATPase PilB [Elusimicrobiota bacterium]
MQRLGDMLIAAKIITPKQLEEALTLQKQTGEKLGSILVNLGYITEEVLLSFLARQKGFEFVYLSEYEIEESVINLLPRTFIEKHNVFPVSFDKKSNTLVVAIPDPFNIFVLDDLKLSTGFNIKPVIATPNDIKQMVNKFLLKEETTEIDKTISELEKVQANIEVEHISGAVDTAKLAEEEPIVKLANNIIITAVRKKASDIHLEPFEKKCRLRYRIDGVAREETFFPHDVYNAIIARIKIMSKLDVTETRKPQDGRIKMLIDNREIDFRVSILPVVYGEKAVLRILDSSALCLDLEKLGFEPEVLQLFLKTIRLPYGLILITGPTGSGKSTTLYSALATLNRPEVNIMTIEDPVEYILQGITQVNVNPEVGLTFATGLRAFLRQAPDIILVGEIRDTETAKIAVQAALTGQLVFSTLHTNDAPSAVTRLHNMGIDPFLISSTLTLVEAQRLVRRICTNCKQAYQVPVEKLYPLGVTDEMVQGQKIVTLYKGAGCSKCNGGYKGRIGIYEVMEVTDEIRELILRNASDIEIRKAAIKNGMQTLRKSALRKMLAGITTVEEVLRVTIEAATE